MERSPKSERADSSEGAGEELDRLNKLYRLLETQSKAIMELAANVAETSKGLEALKEHQDRTDEAIIEVAKKVGTSSGGGGNLLAQLLPLIMQPKAGPLEKVAMNAFLRNMAFTSLTTERLAKKQFGEEYTRMVKDMEAEIYGTKGEEPE